MEEEIRRERHVAQEVVQAMPAAKQEAYVTMTTANEELLQVGEVTALSEGASWCCSVTTATTWTPPPLCPPCL